MRRVIFAAALAAFSTTSALQAQEASGTIALELNKASPADDGGCQFAFFAANGLTDRFDDMTWRIALFDAEGGFMNLVALRFTDMIPGKRKILRFNLPQACSDLSEIIVNDVSACKVAGGGSDNSDACLSQLTVTSRADIAFGL